MRWLIIALFAGGGLAAAIAVQLPAANALGWLQRAMPALRAGDADGTLWNGEAEQVSWDGYAIGALAWTLDPVDLLRGRVGAVATVSGREVSAQADIDAALSGREIELSSVDLRAPAAWIQQVLATPFLQLQGALVADLDRVEFVDGYLSALEGATTWEQAAVAGRIVTALGELRVDWETHDDRILGRISDAGGPLKASGTVSMAQRRYEVDLLLAAPDGPDELRQALYVLGSPDPDGVVNLKINGELVAIL